MKILIRGGLVLGAVLFPALATAQPLPTGPALGPTLPGADLGNALLGVRCRNGDYAKAHKTECSPVLRAQFEKAVERAGTETVVIGGKVAQGVRERFDRTKVAQLATSEGNFSAVEWPLRYQSGPDPTAPKQPAYEDALTSSCNELAYRRFYEANRYLESLGAYGRNHAGALGLLLDGAGQLPALASRSLLDTDHRVIKDLAGTVTGVMSPQAWTGPKNEFFGATTVLAQAGPIVASLDGDPALAQDLRDALAFARLQPFVTVTDSWRFARDKHAELQRRFALTQAEREDIAERLDKFESAMRRHNIAFQRCLTNRFAELSAVAPSLAEAIDLLRGGAVPGRVGDIDPSPLAAALDLEARLLDPGTRAATLSRYLGTQPPILHGLSGTLESNESLLSTLSLDRTALQRAVVDVSALLLADAPDGACALASQATADAVRLLVAEWRLGARGCLASDRCDFSLPRFLRATSDRLAEIAAPADEMQDRCVRTLGPGEIPATRLPVSKRARIQDVEAFITAEIARLQAILGKVPRASTLSATAIGDRKQGGSTWGDPGSFGAEYHYVSDWGIEPAGSDGNGQVCRVAGQVIGELAAKVTVFGVQKPVIDAALRGTSERAGTFGTLPASVSGHLTVLDERLYEIPANASFQGRYRYSHDGHQDQELFEDWFLIGPIPVKIAAGVKMTYGAALSLAIAQGPCDAADPRLSIKGRFEPKAGVGAWVTAAVDLFLVSAGIRGDLTLIEAGLPLDAGVSVGKDARTAEPLAVASATLDLVLQELSGAVSVFVTVLGIPFEHELFSWDGLHQTVHLWRESARVPLRAFAVAQL